MQMEGLSALRKVVKDKILSNQELSELIGQMQTLDGNERDFLRVADGEYLIASRKYENKGLSQLQLDKELNGLAARYLKLRPLFESHGPAPEGLTRDAPETAGCQLVGKEKDLLGPYERWRAASTGASAVETMAALELYKRDKKSYPEQLSALLGSYLSRMPVDYFSEDGKFSYQKEGDDYRLQSLTSKIPGNRKGIYLW
jgi:hypothetical protein